MQPEITTSVSFLDRTRIALGHAFKVGTARSVAVTTWPSALRRGLLVGAITIVATATGDLTAGFAVAIGALNLGLVDGVVPRFVLARVLILVTIGTGIVCFLSTLAAGTWLSLPLLVLLAYGYGCLAGSGFVAMHAALVTFITGVVFSSTHGDVSQALTNASFAVIGCLLQMASSLIAWRYERIGAIRRSLGQMLLAIGELAHTNDVAGQAVYEAASRELACERALAGARLEPGLHEHYALILTRANSLRIRIARWASVHEPDQRQRDAVVEALRMFDAQLRNTHRRSGDPLALLADVPGDNRWHELHQRFAELSAAITAPIDTRITVDTSLAKRADSGMSFGDRVQPWLALLTPAGPMARHGLRLAIAIGIAQTLTLAFDIPRGYWLSVTVLICLQPDFAATLTHGAQRAVGTVAGVLLIGTVVFITGGWSWLLVAIVVVTAVLIMKFTTANYGMEAFFITCFVAALLESVDPTETTILLRLLNTLAGFVIALLVYLALPSWKTDGVHTLLARTVDAHRKWCAALVTGLHSPSAADTETLRTLGRQARDATLQARPAAEAALVEPHNLQADPRAEVEVLAAIQSIGVAGLAIESSLRENPDQLHAVDPQEFVRYLDRRFADAEGLIVAADSQPIGDTSTGITDPPTTGDIAADKALRHLATSVETLVLAANRVASNSK